MTLIFIFLLVLHPNEILRVPLEDKQSSGYVSCLAHASNVPSSYNEDSNAHKSARSSFRDLGTSKSVHVIFNLAAILPNNVFLKRDYRRALQNMIREHNAQPFTKNINIGHLSGMVQGDKQVGPFDLTSNVSTKDYDSSDMEYTKLVTSPSQIFSKMRNFVERETKPDYYRINLTTSTTNLTETVTAHQKLMSDKIMVHSNGIYNYKLCKRLKNSNSPNPFVSGPRGKEFTTNAACATHTDRRPNDHRLERLVRQIKDTVTPRQDRGTVVKLSYEIRAKEFYLTSNLALNELMTLLCDKIIPTMPDTILFVNNEPQAHSPATASSLAYFFKTIDSFGIPAIVWNPDNSVTLFQKTLYPSIIQLAPLMRHQILAILALMERYSWERFVIITNVPLINSEDIVYGFRNQLYYSESRQKNSKYKIVKVITLESFSDFELKSNLDMLRQSSGRIFILNVNREQALKVFKVANDIRLTGKDYMWIVTQGVIGNKQEFLDFDKNQDYPIGLFGVYYKTAPESSVEHIELGTEVFVNAVSEFVRSHLDDVSILNNFTGSKEVVLTCEAQMDLDSDDLSSPYQQKLLFYKYLNSVNFEKESNKWKISFARDGSPNYVRLDMLNLNAERNWHKIGEWSMEEGLKIKDITWPGNGHLPPKDVPEQFHLKIISLEEPPFVIPIETPETVVTESFTSPPNNIQRETADSDKSQNQTSLLPQIAVTTSHSQAVSRRINIRCDGGVPCQKIRPPSKRNNSGLETSQAGVTTTCCSGYFIDILEKLSQDLSFTYDLSYTTEVQAIGAKKGKSDVVVDTLVNGQAEMAIGLTITSRHSEYVDFSVPFLETGIAIAVSLRTGSISPIAFLEPFDYLTWIMILIICIHAAAFSIFIYEYISPMGFNLSRRDPTADDDSSNFSVFRAIWLAWAILFGASVQVDVPKSHTSRYLITIWSMVAMVFIASYTANLAAFMISKEDHYDFVGIHDYRLRNPYLKEPPYKYATVAYSTSALNIKKNYPDMYSYMTIHNKTDVKDGIASVKNGSLDAFIYDGRVLEYLVGRDDQCKILTVGSWFAMTGYSIAFPKASEELKNSVDAMLMKYQENGDMDRLQHFWLAGDCKLKKNQNDASHPLGLRNFISAFTLLGAGLVLSLAFLGLEHFYFRILRKHLKKFDKHGICSLLSLNMGRTLSFEKTVLELKDKFIGQTCSNIVCKTKMWKLKQELLMAELKSKQLEKMVESLRSTNWKGYSYNDQAIPRNGFGNRAYASTISGMSKSRSQHSETYF